MTTQDAQAQQPRAKREARQFGEFYAGWNAAIRAMRAQAEAQGWWFPESASKLLVEPDEHHD